MRTDQFDFDLPPELIAQHPCRERDRSRLMVVDRADGSLQHRTFIELADLLNPGDLLVLNDTRVLPARLLGKRARTGGAWEGLFLGCSEDGAWELLCQTRGRLTEGEAIQVEPGDLVLTLTSKTPEGHWLARPSKPGAAAELLAAHGHTPLPPYIRKGRADAADKERYQTVFARRPGAVAAPTAGLHFTPQVFDSIERRSIAWTFITLHVGLGTFQPIQVENIAEHTMHCEWGELPAGAVEAIANYRRRGNRVVAVGTTSVRVLETAAAAGPLRPWSGDTELFIHPPYNFKAVDALVTNFHLPRSSLLLLVSAFAGIDLMKRAYKTAIDERYRFYSYGDAMLIL